MAQMIDNGRGKKYALLTAEMYKNLKNANQSVEQTESAQFTKVKKLDDKIRETLQNNNLSETDKALLYSQIAAEFIDLREEAPETGLASIRQPIVEPINTGMQHENLDVLEPPDHEPILLAYEMEKSSGDAGLDLSKIQSESRRDNAENILSAIQNQPELIDWHPQGDLQVFGAHLKGAKIQNILDFVTKKNPSSDPQKMPRGTIQFLEALGEAEIDPKLVPNLRLRNYLLDGASSSQYGEGVIRWKKLYD